MNDSSDAARDIFTSLDQGDKHVQTASDHSNSVHDDAMFQLSHYVSDPLPHDDIQNEDAATAQHGNQDETTETALKMVHFHDENDDLDHHENHENHQHNNTETRQAAVSNFELDQHLHLLRSPVSTSHKISSSSSAISSPASTSRLPTATPTPPARKDISVVAYAPDQKARRLGRPRNKTGLSVDEVSASDNMDRAVMSKFRFDSLPVEGPGSRGGDAAKRRNPRGKITGQRKQAQSSLLNFFSVDTKDPTNTNDDTNGDNNSMEVGSTPTHQSNHKSSSIESTPQYQNEDTASPKPAETSPKTQTNSNGTGKTVSKPPARRKVTKPRVKHPSRKITPVSRTTVINNRHKITRQLPGPLVGLYYDSYDDNTLSAKENQPTTNEKIALGWPVTKSHYAADITYIIAFISKFNHVIDFPSIGPQDIEQGLGISKTETQEGDTDHPVSPLMEQLFCKLLTLILNRRKPILSSNYAKSITELKAMTMFLGLPKEWRDDSRLFIPKIDDTPNHDTNHEGGKQDGIHTDEPVDPQMSQVFTSESHTFDPPTAKSNPFTDRIFEQDGLRGIPEPKDRLIMLRCLIQWCLVASNEVKTAVAQSIQNQDIPGDKDTAYGARSVLKGFKMTHEVKRETELKLAKRNKSSSSLASDNEVKYVDPTSNPLNHSMRLRLDELIVGDIGFHIGRFYLVRMADESNGGLSSIDKMKYIWSSTNQEITSPPSQFKLYVQDVHKMLTESLAEFGVEFDDEGNEVKQEAKEQRTGDYWYEVASNVKELDSFLKHLELRLGFGVTEISSDTNDKVQNDLDIHDTKEISKNSMIYKPLLNMYNYLSSMLSLIQKQEEAELNKGKSRSTRNKKINYSDAATNRKLRRMMEIDNEDGDNELQDYVDADEQNSEDDHEDYDEMQVIESNDEDEDYSD